jgi:outer membrane PBP1 activator LpoA protein
MNVIKQLISAFVAIILFFQLTQCTKMAESHLQVNKANITPFAMPAHAYLAMADKQQGETRDNLRIMAAGRYIFDGQLTKGEAILNQLPRLLPPHSDERRILLAKIAFFKQNPDAILSLLSSVKRINQLSLFYQTQYHELLSFAYTMKGNIINAMNERIKMDPLLPDDSAKMNNRRLMWLSLTHLSYQDLKALMIETSQQSMWKGWLSLAMIAKENISGDALYNAIIEWKTSFPTHPGNAILPSPIERIQPLLFNPPREVAFLLPLKGPLSAPGNAIKAGALKAIETLRNKGMVVKFYDTSLGNVDKLYDGVISNGADMVIGPLTKPDVLTVANMPHPVPTLLLNDVSISSTNGAYLFGLSMSNEARQVAVKARKSGLKRAIIIAPSDAWGNDIVSAFSDQWSRSGGDITDTYRYFDRDDFNQRIRQLMRASGDASNNKQGQSKPISSYRRQDVDMIFLVGYPSKARQIMPLLRYYYLGDTPVYSISAVYAGYQDPKNDKDLEGIIFCDMPYILRQTLAPYHFPENLNSYYRLFAMGYDSIQLTIGLNKLFIFPASGFNELSGTLYLNGSTISRILVWGQFRQGIVQSFSNDDGR